MIFDPQLTLSIRALLKRGILRRRILLLIVVSVAAAVWLSVAASANQATWDSKPTTVRLGNNIGDGPLAPNSHSTTATLTGNTVVTNVMSGTGTEIFTTAQDAKPTEVRELKQGEPIERELGGGQAHSYRVMLTAGQYLKVIVEQKGIDVVVSLLGPDGKQVTEVDSPNGTKGPESIAVIAEAAGEYRLAVKSMEKKAAAARYEIKLEEFRESTTKDRDRIVGERAFAEAERLRAQGTAESLRKAIEKYNEALPSLRAAEDSQKEATTLTAIGFSYWRLGENKKSLDYYSQSLPLMRAVKDRSGEASTLQNFGTSYWQLGESQKALEYFNQALSLRRELGEPPEEAMALGGIGNVYMSLGRLQEALDYYNQSLKVLREVGDRQQEANRLTSIGVTYTKLGDTHQALEHLTLARSLHRQLGNHRGEGITLINIGAAYESLGELQKSLEYYDQALSLLRLVGDRTSEGGVLNNIGFTSSRLGDLLKAQEYYNQSLLLRRATGDRVGEGYTLDNLGQVYSQLNEPEKALQYYHQALELRRSIGDRVGQGITLHNLGRFHQALGDLERALSYFDQALSLKRETGDRRGQAETLNGIGGVYLTLGELRKALDYHNQSLSLSRTIGDRYVEAYALANLGLTHAELGELQKALEYFDQALKLTRTVGNRPGEVLRLHNIGATYSRLGEPDKALEYYTQALALSRVLGTRREEAAILLSVARVKRDRGNVVEARGEVEAAIKIIESTRAKVASQDLRTSYLASKQDYYEFYIDLLMQMHQQQPSGGHDVSALAVSERARARSLLETLTEARADIRQGVDPALLDRERSLQQQLNAKSERLTRLLGGKHTEEQEVTAKKEVEALLTAYQDVEAQIRSTSPRYAALTQPEPLSLKGIQQLLDKETLLLEYALGKERSYLWAVTPTSIRSFELPGRAEVEAATRRVYDLLTARNERPKFEEAAERRSRIAKADGEYPQAARALSQILLGPVANQLANKRLLIVGDGALQYLPFVALPLPGASEKNYVPLIAKHEVVNLPSATTLSVLRRKLAGRKTTTKTVAVLADPVFDSNDDRVKTVKGSVVGDGGQNSSNDPLRATQVNDNNELTRSVRDLVSNNDGVLPLPRLPFTRKEAEAVVAFAPASKSEKAVDFDANRATALDPALSQYRYLHFATHVILNTRHPELTGIVLSLVTSEGKDQNGFLLAHEIYNLNLPVELVVLSGCRTGLGKEIRGEGIVSLTRGFMYAGADRVMVSLWDVNDRSTAELMTRVYERMLTGRQLRPPAALRQAQMAMWKSRQWQAPYYWGAFVVHGEYR